MDLNLNISNKEKKKKFLKTDFYIIFLLLLIPLIELSETYLFSKLEFVKYGILLAEIEGFSLGFFICYIIFRRKFK